MFGSEQREIGIYGGAIINDTTPHTGIDCIAFQAITASVLTSITAPLVTDASNLVGETISAGQRILIPFTAITLSSGVIQTFNKSKPA